MEKSLVAGYLVSVYYCTDGYRRKYFFITVFDEKSFTSFSLIVR